MDLGYNRNHGKWFANKEVLRHLAEQLRVPRLARRAVEALENPEPLLGGWASEGGGVVDDPLACCRTSAREEES